MPKPLPKTHKEIVQEFLGKVAKKTRESAQVLRPHSRKEKFYLKFLSHYLSPTELKRVSRFMKQKKAKVRIERKGFSFLISGRDFLPVVSSRYAEIRKINDVLEERFWRQKIAEFSRRAWTVFPEYIGPIVAGQRKLKSFLMLLIFARPLSALIVDRYGTARKLVQQAKFFGEFKVTVVHKKPEGRRYAVTFIAKKPKLGKFSDLAKKASKVVHLKEFDIEFLERYVEEAKKLEVFVPKTLKKKLKTRTKIELAKAAARVELRKSIAELDIERVNSILK